MTNLANYPADAPPVFFGHYWMPPDAPKAPLAHNIVTLDYSAATEANPLYGYRWDGEHHALAAKFVTHGNLEFTLVQPSAFRHTSLMNDLKFAPETRFFIDDGIPIVVEPDGSVFLVGPAGKVPVSREHLPWPESANVRELDEAGFIALIQRN